jgi:cyclopropane fatty-acyl-phospholipid synthase-like methyltransferase
MKLKTGDKVLDLGCGVGGPLRRIAYLTGAHVTGVTISQYQIQRAKVIGEKI